MASFDTDSGQGLEDLDPAAARAPILHSTFHCCSCETKGEDASIVSKSLAPGVSLYSVADGHNGGAAVRMVAESLPAELARQLGGAGDAHSSPEAVRAALARTFLAVNDSVCSSLFQSGCTLTAAVISGGDTLTLANVGDSRAILDTGSEVIELTAEHRIGASHEELSRLEAAGGRLARLNEYGAGPSCGVNDGVGPVRLWPGGIMVGRAIGDRDVGELLIASPHIKQIKLPATGARLIIASDGLWDAMPAGRVARVLRAQASAQGAAMQAVHSVNASLGGLLRDDVTVLVIDFLPPACRDFRRVCQQFQGRLRSVLSNPQLSSLVMDQGPPATVQEEEAGPAASSGAQAPRRSGGSGLFACFSKPAVVDPDCSRRSGGRSARGGAGNWSTRSGGHNPSLGGSEKSVHSGAPMDPSIRGCKRATSVELLYEGDTARWSSSKLGRAPRLSGAAVCSRRSSSSSAQRSSPRSVALEGLAFGLSLASMSSEDDNLPSPSLAHTLSLPVPTEPLRRSLTRKTSATLAGEKKQHGSMAAATLLSQTSR